MWNRARQPTKGQRVTATGSKTDSPTNQRGHSPGPSASTSQTSARNMSWPSPVLSGSASSSFTCWATCTPLKDRTRLNHYAEGLREIGEPIAPEPFLVWIGRLGLLAALALHLHAAWALCPLQPSARGGVGYDGAQLPGRQLRQPHHAWTGIIILLFIALAPG